MTVLTKSTRRLKRRRRVRAKITGTEQRPRISVFRSNRGLSAQLIDDATGRTLASVHWYEPDLRALAKAERAQRAGAQRAVFDRGGYRYHGHVQAFAQATRGAGLEF